MSKFRIPSRSPFQMRAPTLDETLFENKDFGGINANKVLQTLSKIKDKDHQSAALYRIKGIDGSYRAIKSQNEWINSLIDNYKQNNHHLKHIYNMCKFNKVQGVINNFQNDMYFVNVDNTFIRIPHTVMHRFPNFSESMMDGNHLKIGSTIILVKKDERTYYPDHETYGVKSCPEIKTKVDGSYLLQYAKPYKQSNTLSSLVGKLSTSLMTLPEDTRTEVLMVLSNTNMTEEAKTEKLTSMVNFPLDFVESQTLEKKSSLFHYNGKTKDEKAQVKEIVESIVAMCNCQEQKPCQLIIGVDDKTNKTCKLQDEIASQYPQMETLDKFQSTFLVPFIKSYTYDNPLLMSSLQYNWYSYNGDLILIIDINYHGDPIICKDGRLPYRCGTSKMVAEGMDLVGMVKKLVQA